MSDQKIASNGTRGPSSAGFEIPRKAAAQAKQLLAARNEAVVEQLTERYGQETAVGAVKNALKASARELATTSDLEVATHRERIQREAKATVSREEAEADLRLPPSRDDYTLKAYLSEPRPARLERIESMQRAAHKTLLVAGYKTGKTTLHANLTRALTDGTQFLGRFAVESPQGRIGIWNGEMEAEDFMDYLGDAGVTKTERVAIWNLRGYRVPLTSDAAREEAVKWLKANDVRYWIIDPWSRICSWSGADENVNAEVAPLLQRVDEIARDAGVEEVLIVHHAGHVQGRPRGASVLPDWADGIWLYSRDEEDKRYLKAEGRGIGIDEGLVEIDEHGHAIYRPVSRKASRMNSLMDEVVAFVTGNPGVTTSEVQDSLTASNSLKTSAVKKAVEAGRIRQEADPADKRRKLLFPRELGMEL